ncbi:hypothetical protein [Shewanella sp. ENK2]|uniref:hypothetical protein n=1 Tax=Shewanella sp. ENK2 TaxID=2775245 RepID=UPI003749923D
MSINAAFIGQLLVVLWVPFTIYITWSSYKLGSKKTSSPKLATAIGFLLAFFPPLALIYIAVLVMIKDNSPLEPVS